MIRTNNGPTQKQFERLDSLLEIGYTCSNRVRVKYGIYVCHQLQCGDYIEAQLYNPNNTTGKKLTTDTRCVK